MVDLSSEMAELWASLGAPPPGRARAIEFIAASAGEGVSTVAREFALYAARGLRRRVWLIDLDLTAQSQLDAVAREPARFGPLGAPASASPDGSMFFTVQPPLKRPDGRPWPDPRYVSAHSVGGAGFWATRFRREALRGRQEAQVLPDASYWNALRRHAELIVVDAPPADRSEAGLTVAPFMDQVVIVVAADHGAVSGPVQLRDDLADAGARLAGLFVNQVQASAPPILRGAAP
jgi:Mrp family chromosome partitioning ATPase